MATTHNFSDALTAWKEINLTELQKTLDAQGIEVVNNQKESLVGRKALADRTREFKKSSDEEKLTEIKTLVRAYQTEIDNLTRRTKTAETVFLNVYKVLAEAPDPYPLLDAAVDQTMKISEAQALEVEVRRLREENAELRRKNNEIGSLEAAKKRAEAKVEALEQKMEDAIKDRVAQKETELNATYDEKIMNYEERERDLQRQANLVKGQLRDLRNSNETQQAKLLDQSERQDAEVVAKLAEMDMLVADLERANSRVAAIERRNELLRAEIEAVRTGREANDKIKVLESRVAELETEASSLLRALETQKALIAETDSNMQRKLAEASKDLSLKSSEVDHFKQRLKQYSDYDEIKRELEIMKYVEFSGFDAEDGEDDSLQLPDPNAQKANQQQAKSLETLLSVKNKKLLEELTRFRVLHAELEASFRSVSEDLATCRADLERQKVLNDRLENDLLHVDQHMGKANADRLSGTSTPDPLTSLNIGTSDTSARATPTPFSSSADTSILPIVTSQRDRFRQRNAELEEELRKQFDIISELRTEIKTLQSDNLKLYEKVRYMQSYRDETATTAGPSSFTPAGAPLVRSQKANNVNDDLGKYRNLYEQTMNPFEAFRGREAARAVQALNPIERGVLSLTRAILGNRRTRLFFIIYALGLHALVLFTSYECTSVGSAATSPIAHGSMDR